MRNSRALGHALVAAVACVADDPPPSAGDRHGLSSAACVVGRFVRATGIRVGWMPVGRGTRFVYEETLGWPDRGQALEATSKAGNVHIGWRAPGAKNRATHQVIQIALDPGGRDRVRTGAMEMLRNADQCSPRLYGNMPPAVRAPPTPLTDSRRGDQP